MSLKEEKNALDFQNYLFTKEDQLIDLIISFLFISSPLEDHLWRLSSAGLPPTIQISSKRLQKKQ